MQCTHAPGGGIAALGPQMRMHGGGPTRQPVCVLSGDAAPATYAPSCVGATRAAATPAPPTPRPVRAQQPRVRTGCALSASAEDAALPAQGCPGWGKAAIAGRAWLLRR